MNAVRLRAGLLGMGLTSALLAGCLDFDGLSGSVSAPADLVSPDASMPADLISLDAPIRDDLGPPLDLAQVDLAIAVDLVQVDFLRPPDLVVDPCANKVRDGNETDIDCGGGMCRACGTNKMCQKNADCVSLSCVNNTCAPPPPVLDFLPAVVYPVDDWDRQLSLADMNADGKLDVVVGVGGNNKREIAVFLGKGDGTLGPPKITNHWAVYAIAAADFDRDGRLDVAVEDDNNGIDVRAILGNGDGTFQMPPPYVAFGNNSGLIRAVDVTNDGAPDVVGLVNGAFGVAINGNGRLNPPVLTNLGLQMVSFAVGDLNGDKNVDAVVGTFNGFTALGGLGNATFAMGATTKTNTVRNAVALGDLDNDGKLDVVTVGSSDVISCLGNGDGTFGPPAQVNLGNPVAVALADYDGDGKLDAAVPDLMAGQVSILLGKGDGSFKPPVAFNACNSAFYVEAGDFNNDKRPDLALTCVFSSQVSVLINATQ